VIAFAPRPAAPGWIDPRGGRARDEQAGMTLSTERARWLAHHVLPHEPALRAWLRRRPVVGLEVDDIVQETYAVLAAVPSTDHIDSPRAYAFQAAQSIILRHFRRARVVRIEAFGDIEAFNPVLDAPSAEQEVTSRQELLRVLSLMEALPEKCREAFMLRKLAGFSQRQVAQRMGISESTVEKHIGRALRTLMDVVAGGGNSAFEASGSQKPRNRLANADARTQQRH
jgi:RNA polymerase sigma factor (sigma-70 family)